MKLKVYVLSDKNAVAINDIVHKSLDHFPIKKDIVVHERIKDIGGLSDILHSIKEDQNLIIYHLFLDPKLKSFLINFSESRDYTHVGLMDYSIKSIAGLTGLSPLEDGLILDSYDSLKAKRLDALDFAIKYDDGQDLRGLKSCDIAIIGVSRSSKTPLSMYLASKGYRVSNIPLLVDSKAPQELFEIDPDKIFGLTIDKAVLKKIREERLKSLGLSQNSLYSSTERIAAEIDYALELMNDLGASIIDVSYRSIEETSDIIISKLNKNKERNDTYDK